MQNKNQWTANNYLERMTQTIPCLLLVKVIKQFQVYYKMWKQFFFPSRKNSSSFLWEKYVEFCGIFFHRFFVVHFADLYLFYMIIVRIECVSFFRSTDDDVRAAKETMRKNTRLRRFKRMLNSRRLIEKKKWFSYNWNEILNTSFCLNFSFIISIRINEHVAHQRRLPSLLRFFKSVASIIFVYCSLSVKRTIECSGIRINLINNAKSAFDVIMTEQFDAI